MVPLTMLILRGGKYSCSYSGLLVSLLFPLQLDGKLLCTVIESPGKVDDCSPTLFWVYSHLITEANTFIPRT